MNYTTTITQLGPLAAELLENNMLIIFDETAPKELHELTALHTVGVFDEDVKNDDIIVIGDKEYLVTAVGHEANETLRTMGHCTLCFNGADQVEIPGHIELLGEGLPNLAEGIQLEIIHT